MIRKPTQRPTEKTDGRRRPFFIGSRPEPVSRGGIFLSALSGATNCTPGVCYRRRSPKGVDDKIHISLLLGITAFLEIHVSGVGPGLFAFGGRILQQRDRAPRSSAALLLRGFRGPSAEAGGARGA